MNVSCDRIWFAPMLIGGYAGATRSTGAVNGQRPRVLYNCFCESIQVGCRGIGTP